MLLALTYLRSYIRNSQYASIYSSRIIPIKSSAQLIGKLTRAKQFKMFVLLHPRLSCHGKIYNTQYTFYLITRNLSRGTVCILKMLVCKILFGHVLAVVGYLYFSDVGHVVY